MTTTTLTKQEAKISRGYETSKFALATGFSMAALVGIWACACMISALVNGGFGGAVKGLITAITGT